MEELVEDKVVRGAIERWRKECWVRFLLRNNSNMDFGTVIHKNCEDNTMGGGKEKVGGVPSIKDIRKIIVTGLVVSMNRRWRRKRTTDEGTK